MMYYSTFFFDFTWLSNYFYVKDFSWKIHSAGHLCFSINRLGINFRNIWNRILTSMKEVTMALLLLKSSISAQHVLHLTWSIPTLPNRHMRCWSLLFLSKYSLFWIYIFFIKIYNYLIPNVWNNDIVDHDGIYLITGEDWGCPVDLWSNQTV